MRPLVLDKAEDFGVRVTNAYKYLSKEKHETVISKQLLRSGTAISALIAEAQYAQSRADFISKYQIALKEANESRNWITILYRTAIIDQKTFDSIYNDANQLVMIISKIVRTAKKNNQ